MGLFDEAKRRIPGGVNSPVRAFKAVGGDPVFITRGSGSRIYDTAGNGYIDYVGSWGPMILGHAHPAVIRKVMETAANGLSFGAPTVLETRLAEMICDYMPALEKIRMVNSGTEAAMSAIRLARGYTGRDRIIKFEGCYHGHADSLLVKAGSGALTMGVPTSPGVPADLARHTVTLQYNDPGAVLDACSRLPGGAACIIVEPVAGNMNCVPATQAFLTCLQSICRDTGALLIFDEVMTGFRVAAGGAQARYGIQPDLTVLGKVIGGGLPVGAFGGRSEIMDYLAPDGPVYQAGTLSGNPVAMAAGIATLEQIGKPGFFESLEHRTCQLTEGLNQAAADSGTALTTNCAGGMFGLFFTEEPEVQTFAQVMACDKDRFRRFFHGMLRRGVYLAPSPFEAGFVSSAHTGEDIRQTLSIARDALGEL